ncbi:MAG: hypothetical protein AAF921_19920 [Cyanobacteria bacterium P01_D01_bin.44]
MLSLHLLLFGFGLLMVWRGWRMTEEVYHIATVSTGAVALIWGFAISPDEIQMTLEALSLGWLKLGRK